MAGDGLTAAPGRDADPVEAHVRALAAVLHGPARLRESLLTEARDGLEDAADALRHNGLDTAEARHRAVADFGAVHEIAPGYQDELAAAQGRRTAALMAVAFPGLLLSWNLVWTAVPGTGVTSTPLFSFLSRLEDLTSLLAGIAAAVALVTLRRGSPGRALYAVTLLGVLTPVVCVGAAVGMALIGPHGGGTHAVGYVVTGAVLVALVRSVARAHRMLIRTRRPSG